MHDADCEIAPPMDTAPLGGGWGLAAMLLWAILVIAMFSYIPST